MSDACKVSVERRGDVAILWTDGYINNQGGEEIAREAYQQLDAGARALVMNLEKTRIVNSIGISILIEVLERVMDRKGVLAFCGLTPTIDKTFRIMGLAQYASIYPDRGGGAPGGLREGLGESRRRAGAPARLREAWREFGGALARRSGAFAPGAHRRRRGRSWPAPSRTVLYLREKGSWVVAAAVGDGSAVARSFPSRARPSAASPAARSGSGSKRRASCTDCSVSTAWRPMRARSSRSCWARCSARPSGRTGSRAWSRKRTSRSGRGCSSSSRSTTWGSRSPGSSTFRPWPTRSSSARSR